MTTLKLLLVDDERAFLDTMTKRLEKRQIKVWAVYNGTDALDALERNKGIEVVILDVKMPGMDGMETLVEIKKRFPLLEVIMLTGHATVETAIDGMKLGAFDYLMKPCDIDLLLSKATAAASKKRTHEEKIVEARIKEITRTADLKDTRDIMGEKYERPCFLNVLLVDDEKGYLHVLSNRLARRGIKATTAFSGTQAIQILRKNDFHVVVLDLKMEDMDGIEVLKVIKRMVPQLPVIILTGHGSQTAAREGIAYGAFDYLTKPCELLTLIDKIKQAHRHQQNISRKSPAE